MEFALDKPHDGTGGARDGQTRRGARSAPNEAGKGRPKAKATWTGRAMRVGWVFAMEKHRCDWCGHVYDPSEGDPGKGIPPGTAFEHLPDTWRCPDCRAPKSDFKPMDA